MKNKKLNPQLRILLAKKNMRSKELADLTDTSNTTVSNWLSGRSYPTTEKLFLIADVLNCKVDDLYKYE